MRVFPRGVAFSLVFFAITNLNQFLRVNRRLDPPRIEREVKLSDVPPFIEFVVVDVGSFVLRKPEQKHRAFVPAVGDQCPKPTALPLSGAGDPLLDEPATQVGIDQTTFSCRNGFDECRIRNTLTALKTYEALDLVNSHGP